MRKILVIALALLCVSDAIASPVVSSSVAKKGQAYTKLGSDHTDVHGYIAPDVPAILSANDVKVWKKLFSLQRQTRRSDVVKTLPELENRDILMGHLIAVRLMHPRTKVPYTDFQEWLAKYNDLSPAKDVYALANRKRPRGDRVGHKRPASMKTASLAKYDDPDKRPDEVTKDTRKRQQLLRTLKSYRLRQYYTKSMGVFFKDSTRKLLGDETWAQAANKLSHSMMDDGYLEKTFRMSDHVIRKLGETQPEALWLAGFSSYRLGKKDRAAGYFRRLSYSVPRNSKYFAKAAWWTAKTYDELKHPSMAKVFLNLAAKDPYSFYGHLAVARVGGSADGTWEIPEIKRSDAEFLYKNPTIRRVIALAQIGEHGLAQQELKQVYDSVPYDMDESLLALSIHLHLPNTAMTLARNLQERNKVYLSGLYPEAGAWRPYGGYKLSKSLIHAVMRQESAFNPYVTSRAGARGLMQVMPATARFIRQKQGKPRYSKSALYNPSVSMRLGQDYFTYLDDRLEGNLLYMIAGYNAGPGNVEKWVKEGLAGDPALFIESIKFDETRHYVKKVMANLWMYRARFKEEAPGLYAMSRGKWPMQVAMTIPKKSGS